MKMIKRIMKRLGEADVNVWGYATLGMHTR